MVTVDHRISDVLLASQYNLRKNFVYKMLNCWLGDGLLLSNGKKWQAMRKIITPTFHFKILEEFVDVFDRQTNVLIQKLALTDGRSPVNVYDQMGLLTMDIIAGMYENRMHNVYEKSISIPFFQRPQWELRLMLKWILNRNLFKLLMSKDIHFHSFYIF